MAEDNFKDWPDLSSKLGVDVDQLDAGGMAVLTGDQWLQDADVHLELGGGQAQLDALLEHRSNIAEGKRRLALKSAQANLRTPEIELA